MRGNSFIKIQPGVLIPRGKGRCERGGFIPQEMSVANEKVDKKFLAEKGVAVYHGDASLL
jgi:hypothetical protein